MWVNNLPKVATQWNSGTTRESTPGPRVKIPSALTTKPLSHTPKFRVAHKKVEHTCFTFRSRNQKVSETCNVDHCSAVKGGQSRWILCSTPISHHSVCSDRQRSLVTVETSRVCLSHARFRQNTPSISHEISTRVSTRSRVYYAAGYTIDVINFFYVFYSGHVFHVFSRFFYFSEKVVKCKKINMQKSNEKYS